MPETSFAYVAVNRAGRRTRGTVQAADETGAFARLRELGLSPVALRRASKSQSRTRGARVLTYADAAGLLENLAQLLSAGADIRTALAIIRQKQDRPASAAACDLLSRQISGGASLEQAFATCFEGRQGFVAPMIGAAEASGDLPQGLQRAAGVLQARVRLRGQLVSALAYPGFVAVSAIVTVLVILLFVVPAIQPMAEDAGGNPPFALRAMIAASEGLRSNWRAILIACGLSLSAFIIALRLGLLRDIVDRTLLDGPARRISRALTYGRYAGILGSMLSGGASITDALRLAERCLGSELARARLQEVARAVRQGDLLSTALERVAGFPSSILRLASVGEASNSLGEMLRRSGELEEQAALAKLEADARIAGPVIVVLLGLVLGVLMAGLLSGVTGLGDAALR